MRLFLILSSFLLIFGSMSIQAQDSESDIDARKIEAKILNFSKSAFFVIEMTFRDFDASEGTEQERFWSPSNNNYLLRQHANDKTVFRTNAVLMSSDGILLMNELFINFDRVLSLNAISMDGKKYVCEPYGIMKFYDGYLLKIKDYHNPFGSYEFTKTNFEDGEKVYFANVSRFRDKEFISVRSETLRTLHPVTGSSKYKVFSGYNRGLTFDSEGNPVAFVFDQSIVMDTRTGWKTFLTEKINNANSIKLDELNKMFESNKKTLDDFIYKVEIEYRQTGTTGYGTQRLTKSELYGVAITSENVFIPNEISAEHIQRISKITLIQGEKRIEGEFIGLFREFGGLLVKPSEMLPCVPATIFDNRDVVDLELLNVFRYRQRFSRDFVEDDYNRFFESGKGYKDIEFRKLMKFPQQGSFVTTSDGSLIGFCTIPKRYDAVRDPNFAFWGLTESNRYFSFADLRNQFQNPQEFFDPRAKVKSLAEERQSVWLGVEFQRIGLPLAKKLNIREETVDGTLGYLVTLVYPNSPAEKVGIQKDDILLRIKEKGKTNEVNLGAERLGWGYGWGWSSVFNRNNELTEILKRYGAGVTVELTYARNHKIETIEIVVEKSPPDFSSAERYKNDVIGLSVKDITYEIRTILRLEDDFKGVVVYRTESGSSAEVAELRTLDFIIRVDDMEVANIQEFQEVIDKLIEQGKETASFMVKRFTETRFVDVNLRSPNNRKTTESSEDDDYDDDFPLPPYDDDDYE